MSTQTKSKRIFSAAAGATQNSDIFQVQRGEFFSIQVQHPGPGTTTTYTLEGSNTPEDFRGDSPAYTSAVFTDQDARDRDNVIIGAKSAAATFVIGEQAVCTLYRLHMVTSLGTGVITADLARESA